MRLEHSRKVRVRNDVTVITGVGVRTPRSWARQYFKGQRRWDEVVGVCVVLTDPGGHLVVPWD